MRIGEGRRGIVLAGGRAVIRLRRARLALDDRVDELEVARVRYERDRDLAARRLADALGAEVVLHVARAALQVGRDGFEDALALELAQDRVDLAADRVGEDVEPAAVRHAEDDAARAVVGRQLDRLVEHRHHHVEPFDRELLLAEEGAAQVALEALDVGQPAEERLLLVGRERLAERARLDRLPQPEPLLVARDVLELERHRPAIGLPQDRQRLDQRLGRDVQAQDARRDAGHELGRQPRLEPVGVERRVAGRLRAERVEARSEMAVGAMRLHQGHRRGDAAEQQAVGRRLGRRLRRQRPRERRFRRALRPGTARAAAGRAGGARAAPRGSPRRAPATSGRPTRGRPGTRRRAPRRSRCSDRLSARVPRPWNEDSDWHDRRLTHRVSFRK